MIDRMLIPLDGSVLAEAALPFADLIPSRRVRLLAVEPVVLSAEERRDSKPPSPARSWSDLTARAYLDFVAASLRRQGREVELVVEAGDPGTQIIGSAADADLIVMGTRGRGASSQKVFGSVADEVARRAPAPTLLVRGTDPGVIPMVSRIIVPLDGSADAEAALPKAIDLSNTLGVRPHLVTVVDPTTGSGTVSDDEREAEAYLEGEAGKLRSHDVMATTQVLAGLVVPTLLEEIKRGDLVVMTPSGRSGTRRATLGSVAERLVREARSPVLIVR